MNHEIFRSDRYFTLFDTLASHGQLLLRSQKKDDNLNNIDIIFFDATYIQLFGRLNGICIRKVARNSNIKYKTVKTYLGYDNNYLFEIESNSELYYIAASFVKVFENSLNFNESSLNFENKGREKEIATSIFLPNQGG